MKKREIVFRGYSNEFKKFIYGGICIKDEETLIFDSSTFLHNAFDVDSETVGQFTGLLDEKGVEIYEGDILYTVDKHKRFVVQFIDGQYNIINYFRSNNVWGSLLRFLEVSKHMKSRFLVIGNIHENKINL